MSPITSSFVFARQPGQPISGLRPANPRFLTSAIVLLMGLVSFSSAAPAVEPRVCKPVLTIQNAKFSETHPETMLRTWSATVSVDSSRCASTTGRFEIMLTRQKENAPELDFTEPFEWKSGVVEVSVDLWADEAVEGYQATGIAECPCRK